MRDDIIEALSFGFLCVCLGVLIACLVIYSLSPELSNTECTQQRAVSETMPQEFECIQWTKE